MLDPLVEVERSQTGAEQLSTEPIVLDTVNAITPETRYFEIDDNGMSKKIAYTISGNLNADKVLLCLPGLLETKSSFLVLHAYFLKFSECQVISIDVSGRGESDYIGLQGEYKMSMYLSEISALIV